MWLSGQQKRPARAGEGQTGVVTIRESGLAVQLDAERRGLEVYGPAGYRWTPQAGERVLVIQGEGEIPCVAGTRLGGATPESVAIEAKTLALEGETIGLKGQVLIGEERLEDYIARVAAGVVRGGGA